MKINQQLARYMQLTYTNFDLPCLEILISTDSQLLFVYYLPSVTIRINDVAATVNMNRPKPLNSQLAMYIDEKTICNYNL